MAISIHPLLDNGVPKGTGQFAGGTLVCKCKDKPVKVAIKGPARLQAARWCATARASR